MAAVTQVRILIPANFNYRIFDLLFELRFKRNLRAHVFIVKALKQGFSSSYDWSRQIGVIVFSISKLNNITKRITVTQVRIVVSTN